MLRGVSYARLGDPQSARARFTSAESQLDDGDTLRSELLYQRAAADWIERRLDRATRSLERLPAGLDADLDLQVRILKGAIASASENLSLQGAILLEALNHARLRPDPNVYLHAMLITQIAALSVELPSKELRDAALDEIPLVRWTPDIGDLHFHALRAIGWRHALDGDEFNAFRRLKEAIAVTPSGPWRVAALADRAYLAAAFEESRWAAQELRDAHELASSIDWSTVAGEEKLALPTLAELFSTQDPPVAIHYAATFKSVGASFPRVLSSQRDRRVTALEAYAFGKVQAGLGELGEARRLLTKAWDIYSALGIRWRAARTALALAALSEDETWRTKAREELRDYPRCWLSRSAAATAAPTVVSTPEVEGLTAAQRAVFDLLMAGHSTVEIADRLQRSTFTVRNHIKKIFKLFGVNSRPALLVRARGSSLATRATNH
jgi:DNA-binding CsgD family transcriptional regulator